MSKQKQYSLIILRRDYLPVKSARVIVRHPEGVIGIDKNYDVRYNANLWLLLNMVATERGIRRGTPSPIKEGRLFHALHRIHLEKLGGPFALRGEAYLRSPWKRAFDLTLGSLALATSSPAILLGAFAVWAETPRQFPFRVQQRIGKGGHKFSMFKIRSQKEHTEGQGRITPTFLGKLLRRSSIDELPQFLNVVRGEMSLIGQRPMLPHDYSNLRDIMLIHLPYYRAIQRFGVTNEEWKEGSVAPDVAEQVRTYADEVREVTRLKWDKWQATFQEPPGITGLRQIMARRAEDNHRVCLDNFYHEHASLGLDIAILIYTIPAVISARNAR